MNIKKIITVFFLIILLALNGCGLTNDAEEPGTQATEQQYNNETDDTKNLTDTVNSDDTKNSIDTANSDNTENPDDTVNSDDTENPDDTENSTDTENKESYSLDSIPEYSGEPYVVLEDNQPDFSDGDKQITDAFEFYSELDSLGRCGQAYANICPELQPTEARGEIGQVKPSGWHTVKYNDLIDGNYLYNRCHLIGYQLAGENANEKNLITGTRYMNTEGMLPFEDMVDNYVDSTGNHVLYRVTPVFEGDNLVANGVQMEAWSVEDAGEGVCFNVYCYNVQPYIGIDYATGDSWVSNAENTDETENIDETENTDDTEYAVVQPIENDTSENDSVIMDFVLNKNTKKFHLPECSSVNDMAEHNKAAYTGTVEELKEQGYSPCKRCLSEYGD